MENLRQQIIKLCNESGLPLEAILFVIRDVYRDANETFNNYQQKQTLAFQKEEAIVTETIEKENKEEEN